MKIYHSNFDKHKQIIDEKAEKELNEIKVKCKNCGHTMFLTVQQDFKICNYCKNKVYNNTKAYFMYKLKKEMEKNNGIRNEKNR